MRDGMWHRKNAAAVGLSREDVNLVIRSYVHGYDEGRDAYQSCVPICILEGRIIHEFAINGVPARWGEEGVNGKDVMGLMARAYYDGFNKKVIESGVLGSEYADGNLGE